MVNPDFKYKNIPVQQVPAAFDRFADFLQENKFDYVLEIGSSYGGLSLFLHEQSEVHGFTFITFDITKNRVKRYWDGEVPFKMVIGDCFEDAVKNEIIDILENHKVLLLCDGGNKKGEFNMFSPYINEDSYIMAHDYAPDRKTFKAEYKDKIWNWMEIQDSDVKEGLKFVEKSKYYETFRNVAWISCSKKKV